MKRTILHSMAALLATALLVACSSATSGGGGGNPTLSDGSYSTPKQLTLGVTYSGKIGNTESLSDSMSYYKFTTGAEDTSVLFTITDSSQSQTATDNYFVSVYEDAEYNNSVDNDENGHYSVDDGKAPLISGLLANHTYYVEVWNSDVPANLTYKIGVKSVPENLNEGVADPVEVFLGEGHDGYTTNEEGGKSYYVFNTGSHTSIEINYEYGDLDAIVYADSEMTDIENSTDYLGSINSILLTGLEVDTDYWVEIENYHDLQTSRISYRLTIDSVPEE